MLINAEQNSNAGAKEPLVPVVFAERIILPAA
jgi:hypothetical protein